MDKPIDEAVDHLLGEGTNELVKTFKLEYRFRADIDTVKLNRIVEDHLWKWMLDIKAVLADDCLKMQPLGIDATYRLTKLK